MTEITIDMSTPPRLPFKGAKIVNKHNKDKVEFKKSGSSLYLNDKSIALVNFQIYSRLSVGDIYQEIKNRDIYGKAVSAKILDYLEDNPKLWPSSWKTNEDGGMKYVFFWGDIFFDKEGTLYIRCGSWDRGKVISGYLPFSSDVYADNPAAFLKN